MIETFREDKRREAEAAELVTLRGEMDAMTSSVATAESDVATDNHATGSLVVVGGRLYRTTRAVVRGEKITEGINVTPVSVAEVIIEAIESKE